MIVYNFTNMEKNKITKILGSHEGLNIVFKQENNLLLPKSKTYCDIL